MHSTILIVSLEYFSDDWSRPWPLVFASSSLGSGEQVVPRRVVVVPSGVSGVLVHPGVGGPYLSLYSDLLLYSAIWLCYHHYLQN